MQHDYTNPQLSQITRVTGEIPDGHGLLSLNYNVYFGYVNNVKMRIELYTNHDDGFTFAGGKHMVTLAEAYRENIDSFQSNGIVDSLVKQPHPNKNYIVLGHKNKRKQYKYGIPLIAPIEDLNRITWIRFSTYSKNRLDIWRDVSFPVKVDMSEDHPYAYLHMTDYTYCWSKDPEKSILQDDEVDLSTLQPNFQIRTSDVNYRIKYYAWSHYRDIFSDVKDEFDKRPIHEKTQWLSDPEYGHYLGNDHETMNPDSLFLGVEFNTFAPWDMDEPLDNNLVKINGTNSPLFFH